MHIHFLKFFILELTLHKDPPPFVTVAISDKPYRSHAVKNTSCSEEETDNAPTNKVRNLKSQLSIVVIF